MKTYDTRKRCNIVWPEAEAPCGGRVLVQKTGRGEFRWEAYCDTCGLCDMDGYRTLKEAKRTDFFEKSRA